MDISPFCICLACSLLVQGGQYACLSGEPWLPSVCMCTDRRPSENTQRCLLSGAICASGCKAPLHYTPQFTHTSVCVCLYVIQCIHLIVSNSPSDPTHPHSPDASASKSKHGWAVSLHPPSDVLHALVFAHGPGLISRGQGGDNFHFVAFT